MHKACIRWKKNDFAGMGVNFHSILDFLSWKKMQKYWVTWTKPTFNFCLFGVYNPHPIEKVPPLNYVAILLLSGLQKYIRPIFNLTFWWLTINAVATHPIIAYRKSLFFRTILNQKYQKQFLIQTLLMLLLIWKIMYSPINPSVRSIKMDF